MNLESSATRMVFCARFSAGCASISVSLGSGERVAAGDLPDDLFEVEDQDDPVLHLDHAGDVGVVDRLHRRLHVFPRDAVDAGDRVDQDADDHPVELKDDDPVGVDPLGVLVEGAGEVDQRDDLVPQLDHAADARGGR